MLKVRTQVYSHTSPGEICARQRSEVNHFTHAGGGGGGSATADSTVIKHGFKKALFLTKYVEPKCAVAANRWAMQHLGYGFNIKQKQLFSMRQKQLFSMRF